MNAEKHTEGVFCYEATESGDMKMYVVPHDSGGDPVEVTIEHGDLQRMMLSAMDALQKIPSKR